MRINFEPKMLLTYLCLRTSEIILLWDGYHILWDVSYQGHHKTPFLIGFAGFCSFKRQCHPKKLIYKTMI